MATAINAKRRTTLRHPPLRWHAKLLSCPSSVVVSAKTKSQETPVQRRTEREGTRGLALKRRRKPATAVTTTADPSATQTKWANTIYSARTPARGKDLSSWLAAAHPARRVPPLSPPRVDGNESADEKSPGRRCRRPGGFAESAFRGMKRDGERGESIRK